MAENNNAQGTYSEEKLVMLITDCFGITDNGEIKTSGIRKLVDEITKAIVEKCLDGIDYITESDIR